MQNSKANLNALVLNDKFYRETLDAHNELRELHNAEKLSLNLKLCEIAQEYASNYASKMAITNVSNSLYDDTLGENIAFQFSQSKEIINGVVVTRIWYNEVKNHDFTNPQFSPTTGHFTQIVWKKTTDVGFGRAKAKDGSYLMVAKYFPAGNIPGEFTENVLPAIKLE